MNDVQETVVAVVAMTLMAAVVASPVGCTVNRHNKIAEAIRNGADPIGAKCAIEGESQNSNLCTDYLRLRDSK